MQSEKDEQIAITTAKNLIVGSRFWRVRRRGTNGFSGERGLRLLSGFQTSNCLHMHLSHPNDYADEK
jgi:hypothetical protein